MKKSFYLCSTLTVLAFLALALPSQAQVTYTYVGGTSNWSVPADWNPATSTAGPTTLDTAILNNATANQILTYDTGASGALATLTFNQTSAFTDEVLLARSLTLTNALTLGASAGLAELSTGTGTNYALSVGTNAITVNSDGELALGTGNANITTSGVTVNNGGVLALTNSGSGATITGTLTINAGGTLSVTTGASLVVTGNFTMNGAGTNTNNIGNNGSATTGLILDGVTNTIAATSTTLFTNVLLNGGGTQTSLTTASQLGTFSARAFNSGSEKLTSTYAGSGAQVGSILLGDQTRNSGQETLMLGSNLTVSGGLGVSGYSEGTSGTGGSILFGIDTASYTLDFSTYGTTAFNPGNASGIATKYTLTDSTASTGKILATRFVLSTASTGVQVGNSGVGVTLQATGSGANGANDLGNNALATTTFLSTSNFVYAGGGTGTLTSNRSIGGIHVTNSASAVASSLQAVSAITAQNNVQVDSGNTFDANGNTVTIAINGTTASNLIGSGTVTNSSASTAAAVTFGATNTGGLQPNATIGNVTPANLTLSSGAGGLTTTLVAGSNSTFNINSGSSFDTLTLGTNVTMNYNGKLTLDFTGGYNPTASTMWTLVNNGGATTSGTFGTITSNISGDTFSFNAGTGVLTVLSAVPEPSTWALMLGGLAGLVFIQRRSRKLVGSSK